ncbi:receptor-type tyrosine-protein phosphatase T-like [Watersipora subatra]|uniref:receptor-type tyrosine-protein phosphatase T-like n=1 Tax=Watersipora subatra TaxID=2589382 RepID=UPI00355C65D1
MDIHCGLRILSFGLNQQGKKLFTLLAIEWSFSEKEPVVNDTLVTLTLPTPLNLQSPDGYEILLIAVQTNFRVKRELSSTDVQTSNYSYITAELPVSNLSDKFTVGDSITYGRYVNRPLHPGDYTFYIGLKPVTEKVVDFTSSSYWQVEVAQSGEEYTKMLNTGGDTHKYGICQPSGASRDNYLQDEREKNLLISHNDKQAIDVRLSKSRDTIAARSGSEKIKMPNIMSIRHEDGSHVCQLPEDYIDFQVYEDIKDSGEDIAEIYTEIDAGAVSATNLYQFMENNQMTISQQFKELQSLEKNVVTLLRLKDEPDEERRNESYAHYVDATRLKGLNKDNTYIASRGPTPAANNDFLKMVWQEKPSAVIVVYNANDAKKTSSLSYCPKTLDSSVTFENVKVVLLAIEQKCRYVARTLKIYKEKETLNVRQFEFQAWGELSSAVEMNSFVEFVRKVRSLYSGHDGPILVHSSGGEEMSGLFIGLSILLEEAETTGKVNVMECTKRMRERRPQLIKTETEYSLLYEALTETVESETYVCKKQALKKKLKTEKSSILKEYQRLEKLLRSRSADQSNQHMEDSVTDSAAMLDGFYFLDSYRKKDQFIVGPVIEGRQYEEFWEMAISKSIQTIVMLDSQQQINGLLPKSGEPSLCSGKILIDRVNSRCNQMIDVIHLTVNRKFQY